jgi:hypothetical protein
MDTLGVIVDSNGEFTLRRLLTDYILIKKVFNLQRLGDFMGTRGSGLRLIILKNRVADGNAFITDVGARIIARRRYQFANYILAFVTKGASQGVIRSSTLQAVLLPQRSRLVAVAGFNTSIMT